MVLYEGQIIWERKWPCEEAGQTVVSEQSFGYTGAAQTFTATESGCYQIQLWGASGGSYDTTYKGGAGGYTSGVVYLSQNETLYVYVGGAGDGGTTYTSRSGGWNGGGNATIAGDTNTRQASGAGASDVRQVSGSWDTALGSSSRIMVAGGGGGSAGNIFIPATFGLGGGGGGLIGGNGSVWNGTYSSGGTQSDGGSYNPDTTINHGTFGKGYNGLHYAGGGGGYYGGGTAITAGGGSSYISGHTGSVAITSATDQTPKAGCATGTSNNICSRHYSRKLFSSTKMIDGTGYGWTNVKNGLELMPNPSGGFYTSGTGHTGNGTAKITYLGTAD